MQKMMSVQSNFQGLATEELLSGSLFRWKHIIGRPWANASRLKTHPFPRIFDTMLADGMPKSQCLKR